MYVARIDLVLDEAQFWTWSRELAFGYFSKPPVIAWVIRGASELCGDSEACIRSASPVLYTLAAFMLYLTGRALYGPRVGFCSAIVFRHAAGVSYSANLITRSARGGEVALAAFLPPRRLQGTTGTRAEWSGSVS